MKINDGSSRWSRSYVESLVDRGFGGMTCLLLQEPAPLLKELLLLFMDHIHLLLHLRSPSLLLRCQFSIMFVSTLCKSPVQF